MVVFWLLVYKVQHFLLYVCRTKLNEAFSQWQSYDELFNDVSKWLKDFETKLKQETGPQTDLPSKQKQLDVVKVMMAVTMLCDIFVFFILSSVIFIYLDIITTVLLRMNVTHGEKCAFSKNMPNVIENSWREFWKFMKISLPYWQLFQGVM